VSWIVYEYMLKCQSIDHSCLNNGKISRDKMCPYGVDPESGAR